MSAKRALIVDDSRTARTILTRILQRYDLQVDGAASVEEAFEYLAAEQPDVIFMDHLMPGMDGFQALSAIKNDPRTAAIPVMMYTSQEGEVYLNQARALGALGVLTKQMGPEDVGRALQPLQLLGESPPVEPVRAALTPAPPAAAAELDSASTWASDAEPIGMTPELRAHFDALLRAQGVELRRFVAASLAQHTGQIIGEVRALMDGATPAAAGRPAARARAAVATPKKPALAGPLSRPLHGVAAALWFAAAAALIAVAAGAFWYRAQLLEAARAAMASHERVHAAAGATAARSGVVAIRSDPGLFCTHAGSTSSQMSAADAAYAQCGSVGNLLDYADPPALQSPDFAALLTAGEWNHAAAANNRGEVRTRPMP